MRPAKLLTRGEHSGNYKKSATKRKKSNSAEISRSIEFQLQQEESSTRCIRKHAQ